MTVKSSGAYSLSRSHPHALSSLQGWLSPCWPPLPGSAALPGGGTVRLLANKLLFILNLLKDVFTLPVVLTKPGCHHEHRPSPFTILSSEGCSFPHEPDPSRSGRRRSDSSSSTLLRPRHWPPGRPPAQASAGVQGSRTGPHARKCPGLGV